MTPAPLSEFPGEMPPQGAVAQATVQLTPLLVRSFPTTAVMLGTVAAAAIEAESGVTAMVTNGTVIMMVADLVISRTDVAVMVTAASLEGGVVGAL